MTMTCPKLKGGGGYSCQKSWQKVMIIVMSKFEKKVGEGAKPLDHPHPLSVPTPTLESVGPKSVSRIFLKNEEPS